jgi:hypothetical protein
MNKFLLSSFFAILLAGCVFGYDYPDIPWVFNVRDQISSQKTNANNAALENAMKTGTKKVNFAEIEVTNTKAIDDRRNAYLKNVSSNVLWQKNEIHCPSQYTTMAKAIAAAQAAATTTYNLVIDGSVSITTTNTLPSNIKFVTFRPEGYLNLTGTFNYSNQEILAGVSQHIHHGAGVISGEIRNTYVYVEWFGANGEDTVDDTTAFQKTANMKRLIQLNKGRYYVTKFNLYEGGIVGVGTELGVSNGNISASTIYTTDTSTGNIITVLGNNGTYNQVMFKDFSLICAEGTKPGGYGIAFVPPNPGSHRIYQSYVSNILIRYIPGGIDFTSVSGFTLTGSNFYFYTDTGVKVANPYAVDVGDSSITNCTFFNGNGATYGSVGQGILQHSSGGLKIVGNKFNGGKYSYFLDVQGQSSILLMTGNSFENTSSASILCRNAVSRDPDNRIRFTNFVINGNQFAGNQRDIIFSEISEYHNSNYWNNVSIVGNTFYFITDTGSKRDYSLELNSADHFMVAANVFSSNTFGYGAILIPSGNRWGDIGHNHYFGFDVNVSNNARADDIVKVFMDAQDMSGAISCATSNPTIKILRNGWVGIGTDTDPPITPFHLRLKDDFNLEFDVMGPASPERFMYLMALDNARTSYLPFLISSGHFQVWSNNVLGFEVNPSADCKVYTDLNVVGALSKGSGSFDIPHPDPKKKDYRLRHYFVETPSAGGNLYKYQKNLKKGLNKIKLPSYYKFLNKNSLVYVSGNGFGCYGHGYVKGNYCYIETAKKGSYNILIFADRKDKVATKDFEKYGIEYKGGTL